MESNEKEFVKKINVDKASNKIKYAVLCFIVSILSYVIPFFVGEYDFGIVFEILTLVFIFVAKHYMTIYDEDHSKLFITLAMIPVGWLLIYDFVSIILSAYDIVDFAYLGSSMLLYEIFTILGFVMLFSINKDLRKADNPEKYKESTDWFYESLDDKNDGGNKNVWR